jgi:hypothetical protein
VARGIATVDAAEAFVVVVEAEAMTANINAAVNSTVILFILVSFIGLLIDREWC